MIHCDEMRRICFSGLWIAFASYVMFCGIGGKGYMMFDLDIYSSLASMSSFSIISKIIVVLI